MFIGHFGVALAARRVAPPRAGHAGDGSLFIDGVWPKFLLLGWEQVAIEPGTTVVVPLLFVSYPYTHSLLAVACGPRCSAPSTSRSGATVTARSGSRCSCCRTGCSTPSRDPGRRMPRWPATEGDRPVERSAGDLAASASADLISAGISQRSRDGGAIREDRRWDTVLLSAPWSSRSQGPVRRFSLRRVSETAATP